VHKVHGPGLVRSGGHAATLAELGLHAPFGWLAADELEALDSWRFDKRMPSRASAVRELLRRGLAGEGFRVAESGSKSRDFGLLDEAADGEAAA